MKLGISECQEFIIAIFVPSCIEHSDTERTRNHFPLSAFAPEVIRSLDTVIPLLLFSPPKDLPPPGGGSATIMVFEKYYRPGQELEVATTVMPALYCRRGTPKNVRVLHSRVSCLPGVQRRQGRLLRNQDEPEDDIFNLTLGSRLQFANFKTWLFLCGTPRLGSEVKDGSNNRLREYMIIFNN